MSEFGSSALINQVEYRVYRSDGSRLDLSVCEGVDIRVSYPFNEESSEDIDLIKAQQLNEEGIDVFNANDSFFNDICYPYKKNGTDIILKDRRIDFYQNVTLCENNCEYKGINYETKRIQCDCQTKVIMNIESPVKEEVQNNNKKYYNTIASSNIYVTKCYKLSVRNLMFNIGFWYMLTVIVFQVMSLIFLLGLNLNRLYTKLNKFQKSNPPNESNFQKDEEDFFEKYLNIKNNYNENSNYNFENSDEHIKTISTSYEKSDNKEEMCKTQLFQGNRIIDELYIHHPVDIDNYPFYLAIMHDQRNIFFIFWKIIREKHIFLRSIFVKSKYELVSLNICMFLFYMGLLFSLNAIFYTDSSISKRYHNEGKLPQIENMLRSLYSFLISFILLKFVSFLKFYAPIFDTLIQEVKNVTTLGKYFNKSIQIVKRKLVLFYFTIIIFSLFYLYYRLSSSE